MSRLAETSRSHYRKLVHENPDLLNFFQEVTPIEEISKLQISSRPARRKKGAKDLSSLRAIPWVFGWTQSRSSAASDVYKRQIQNSLVNNRLDATPEWNQLMSRLAETSRSHYLSLIHI